MRGAVMHAPGDVRVEDARRPDDHRADRRDHPAVRDLRLRLGPVALPRHRAGRRADARWATSTSASSRRSAATVTTIKPGQFVVGSFFASDNTCEICRAGYQSSCVHRESDRRRSAPRPSTLRVPLADGTLVATPEHARRRPGPEPAGRLRRAGHRLVRRRRRRGRARQDRRRRRRRRGRPARRAGRQAARRRADHRHEPPRVPPEARPRVRRHRHRHRARRRGRRADQGAHRRARRALGHRGGRHPGVDDAGHPLHPPRRPRRLRRRRPRRRAAAARSCSSPTSTCTAAPPRCAGSCPT